MFSRAESRQAKHFALVVFLKRFPVLNGRFIDLRYDVAILKISNLGELPIVTLNTSVQRTSVLQFSSSDVHTKNTGYEFSSIYKLLTKQ
jgi:hypothetical protein